MTDVRLVILGDISVVWFPKVKTLGLGGGGGGGGGGLCDSFQRY